MFMTLQIVTEAHQGLFTHFHPSGSNMVLMSSNVSLAFQGLLMLLQNLPTIHWGKEEEGLLLTEAYRLKYMFADAPNHYKR